MEIVVTEKVRKRILEGVKEAEALILKEMSISVDLRNHSLVKSSTEHLERMGQALKHGILVTSR